MNPRILERVQKRMPCLIEIEGEQQKAIILNLSRAGLFVQTVVKAKRGQSVSVVIDAGHAGRLDLWTQVAWKRRPGVRSYELGGRGLGLQLSGAPRRYLDLCDELAPQAGPVSSAGPAVKAPGSGRQYGIRLRLSGSTRTRRFECESQSEESATAVALSWAAQATPGQTWEVLDVSPLERARRSWRAATKR